jgi:ABC-2 type transport system permease protein
LSPGSTPWLLAHELRLSLRGLTTRKGGTVRLVILGIAAVTMTLLGGVPVAWAVSRVPVHETALLNMVFDLALVAIFTLVLSQTLASATAGFYERGDLDLLLSSPLPSRRVLMARTVNIATVPFLWFAAVLSMFVLPMAAFGQFRWLASYLVLAGLALLAASAGISLTMVLFRLIGARATRTVGQLLAAFMGAAFFLGAQARNVLPDHGSAVFGGVVRWARSGVFDPGAVLSWPARAVLGEPLPLLVFVLASLLIFIGVASGLGRRFSADASVAAGVNSGPVRLSTKGVSVQGFSGGIFIAMVRKELRLLIRDPALLSQVLLRTLYLLPMTFVLLKSAHPSAAAGGVRTSDIASAAQLVFLAGVVTFFAGQVAGSLAWITISAEDAPDLLACAPVKGGTVRRAKLAAAMAPIVLLLAVPLGLLLWLSPWIGLCATCGAAISSASAGLINLWFEKPTPRKAFRNRRGGSVLGAVAEMVVGAGWAVTAGLAASQTPWALAPAVATIAALFILRSIATPNQAY